MAALAIQRGQLEDLRVLFRHIETGSETDMLALKRGCGLVIDLIKLMAARRQVAIQTTRLEKKRWGRPLEWVEEQPQQEPW